MASPKHHAHGQVVEAHPHRAGDCLWALLAVVHREQLEAGIVLYLMQSLYGDYVR